MATVQERFDAFPWAVGVLTGVGAFLVGYLLLVVYVVVGPASLPGSLGDQLRRVGFLFYNAHNILVVPDAAPGVTALPINLLPRATLPFVYQAVPIVVIALASAAITVYVRPETTDGILAIATGMGIALGYLLAALVGTYVFTLTQQGVLYHPQRPTVFVYGIAYPLVVGVIGSVVSQTLWVGREARAAESE
jgi:hypothetical protein